LIVSIFRSKESTQFRMNLWISLFDWHIIQLSRTFNLSCTWGLISKLWNNITFSSFATCPQRARWDVVSSPNTISSRTAVPDPMMAHGWWKSSRC
jgi:hypothetical protein